MTTKIVDEAVRGAFDEYANLRAENRQLVEAWIAADLASTEQVSRLRELLAEGARIQLRFRPEGKAEYTRAQLAEYLESLPETYASWVWTDVEIYETQYPGTFWVFSGGRGVVREFGEGEFENKFCHLFVIEDGRIVLYRQWADPVKVLQARGVEVPSWPF